MTYRARCEARRYRQHAVERPAKVRPRAQEIFEMEVHEPPDKFILLRRKRSHRPAKSLGEWAMWFEHGNNRIARTRIGPYEVSTIFDGLDHSFGASEPLLYETMVFRILDTPKIVFGRELRRESVDYQGLFDRYSTWEQAERGHAAIVARVRMLVS